MTPLKKEKSLASPLYYNNRELSWLAFNQRVLEEVVDSTNPLLERFRFLAIFSANLDEFFMVRVAGLQDQVKAGFNRCDNKSGLTPKQQLEEIRKKTHHLVDKQQQYYRSLQIEIAEHDIAICSIDSLSSEEKQQLEHYFNTYVFPALTPLAIDAYRPFPLLANKSINIAVVLESDQNMTKTATVQVPALLDRFIPLKKKYHYVLLEDLIAYFINKLFDGYHVRSKTIFRITRNADMTIHEEGARDLLKEIEKELKKRKWGAAVRLEVFAGHDQQVVRFLLHALELTDDDLYINQGAIDISFLFSFYGLLNQSFESLVFQKLVPQPAKDVNPQQSIFEQVRTKDILLHHPYESFEVVVDMIQAAAQDPDVLAIKQTLYRVSGDSPIIKSLKLAVKNGKQVTVLVELKARFDEENNLQWAKELEKIGCLVIYGIKGLKTHSKITLIVRKSNDGIERYVHLGTGNYNDKTAAFYTDMSLITTNQAFTVDATNFFNYLSGFTKRPVFHHLTVAPHTIREDFIRHIEQEIIHQKQHGNGHIIAKMNALTDKVLIIKFYQASQAHVKIDLIVRGICCLKAGIPGISDNIRVRSIVGRFLEHSRIYYFHNNGNERFFLSSADMMTRNMIKRVELMFPILQATHQQRIKRILDLILADNVKAREQTIDNSYHYLPTKNNQRKVNSQLELFDLAYQVLDDEE